MRIAFVLTADNAPPSTEDIIAAYREIATSGPVLLADVSDASKENTITFKLGKSDTVHVASMPAPVPDGEAEEAAQYSITSLGTGWELPEHGAHLVVVLQEDEEHSTVDSLRLLTRVVAAVAKAADAVGVYWGDANATHEPEFFIDVARDDLPVMLWTGLSIAAEEGDRLSLLSMGMDQLDLPDLMLTSPQKGANDALRFFFDLLVFVIRREAALPDGDTIGRTPDEKLVIRYVTSPADEEAKVWRVDLPT